MQLILSSVVMNCTQSCLSLILETDHLSLFKLGLLQAKTPTLQWFQEKRNITTRFPQRFCIHLIHLTSKIINYGENWTASIYSPCSAIKLDSFFFPETLEKTVFSQCKCAAECVCGMHNTTVLTIDYSVCFVVSNDWLSCY